MSTLLIMLVIAAAAYLAAGVASRRGEPRTAESVAEFDRALAALAADRPARPRRPARRSTPSRHAA